MSKTKVLLTGACGLLGRHIFAEMKNDYDLTSLDVAGPDGVDFICADIADLTAMREAVRGHEIVIHVAARANVWSGTPEEIMAVNVTGVWNVFRAAELEGVRRVVSLFGRGSTPASPGAMRAQPAE